MPDSLCFALPACIIVGEMTRRKSRTALRLASVLSTARDPMVVALVLGALARLVLIDAKSLWHDEALRLLISGQSLSEVWRFAWNIQFGNPLFLLALHVWLLPVKLAGLAGVPSEGAAAFVRLLPFVGGVLAVWLSLKFVKELIPAAASFPAMFLVAMLPFSIEYSQEVREYVWLGVFELMASLALWRALVERRPVWMVSYGLATVLGALTHPAVWFWWAAHAVTVSLCGRGRVLIRFGLASIPGAAVSVAGFFVTRELLGYRLAAGYPAPSLFSYLWDTVLLLFSGHHVSRPAALVVPAVLVALVVAGTVALWRKRGGNSRTAAILLGAQVIVPVLGVYVGMVAGVSTQSRYIIVTPVALVMLAVAGIGMFPRAWRTALLAALILQQADSFHRWHTEPPSLEPSFCILAKKPMRDVAELVRAGWRRGDVVVHITTASLIPMLWTLPGIKQFHLVGNPDMDPIMSERLVGFPRPLAECLRGARRIWLIACPWRFSDPPMVPAGYSPILDRYCDVPVRYELAGVDVYLARVRR